ncbi:hypothetical protein CLOM_g9653 [Closterium sp. NIES-68]|nr:hypothetical protein CLOM_g9653 [Closterium sp. NIES-68]GJP58495.1 hypothetical protein CLOP_g355 [Closterium sp. NIES-67]
MMGSYVDSEQSPPVAAGLIGGRYLRLRKIGTGSQGDVWECEDIRTSLRVACKSFSPSIRRTRSSVAVLDIDAEMRALQTLGGHPNVVRLIDFFVEPTAVHIVMELVQGGDLCTEICENGPLPEPLAATVLRQLASAVAFCHANGVVHRDIKPENVLLVRPTQEQQQQQQQQPLNVCPSPTFLTPESRENVFRAGGCDDDQKESISLDAVLRNRTNVAARLSNQSPVTERSCQEWSYDASSRNLPHAAAIDKACGSVISSPVRPSVFSRFRNFRTQPTHVGAGRQIVGVKLADFALSTTVDGGMAGQKHGRGAGTRMYMAPEMKERGSRERRSGGRSGGRRSGETVGGEKSGLRAIAAEVLQNGGGEGDVWERNRERIGEKNAEGGGGMRCYGCKADVWSLGVTLCVVLTGLIPAFDQSGCLDFAAPVWRRISWAAKDLVRKMLQVDPNQRLSSFEVLEHPWLNQKAVRLRDIATRCPNLLSPSLPVAAPAAVTLRA